MKKLMILLAVLALNSCAAYYQQIVTMSSPQMKLSDKGELGFSDLGVTLSYDFWSENGQMNYLVTNDTDSDISIDMAHSFLIVNGIANDYYQKRTFSYAKQITSVSSTLASTTTYRSVSTNLLGVYNEGIYGTKNSVEIEEKDIIIIPAHASKRICQFSLLDSPLRKCGFPRNPSKKEEAILEFDEVNTPLVIENRLMIVADGEDHPITNRFYISNIENVSKEVSTEKKPKQDCSGRNTAELYEFNKYEATNKFFLEYKIEGDGIEYSDRAKGTGNTQDFY